jgi:hypothetical protein
MDQQTLESTRRSLHGIAELVLAGPQHRCSDTVRLRATRGGFGTVAAPDLRVERLEIVTPTGRVPIAGTFASLAGAAGVEARSLREVYAGGPDVSPQDEVVLDPGAVDVLLDAFADGDAALRSFAPDQQPVLWPEHFDIAISVAEVNYGVSPGDGRLGEPYAYVGPWTPRRGDFWNAPFGATRLVRDLPDVGLLVEFFRTGERQAAADPPAS